MKQRPSLLIVPWLLTLIGLFALAACQQTAGQPPATATSVAVASTPTRAATAASPTMAAASPTTAAATATRAATSPTSAPASPTSAAASTSPTSVAAATTTTGGGAVNAEAAAALYQQRGCVNCHAQGAVGGARANAPRLAGTQLSYEEFSAIVRNGRGQPPNAMPAFPPTRVSDEELQTIFNWVKGLQ